MEEKEIVIENWTIDDKGIGRFHEISAIPPVCVKGYMSKNKKNVWKILFLALFTSIISYYGFWSLIFQYINVKNELIPEQAIGMESIVIASTICLVTYVTVFLLAVKMKFFKVTYFMLIIAASIFLSSTGIVFYISSILSLGQNDVMIIFIVLFPVHFSITILSFYLARKLVCRVPREKYKTFNFYNQTTQD